MYDYLIVGSGLFGAVFAYEANKKGKKCLVIDKRPNIGGNIYTKEKDGINVHVYGAHIFHTSNKEIWEYINQFAEFNRYTNSPVARYKNELYNLPFNMNTFHELWPDVFTPEDAMQHINSEREELVKSLNGKEPANLEEQAISLIGKTIYEKLIKGYTEKQWGMSCTELPAFIIKRLPVRLIFDNNYFNNKYQGIPIGGYTKMIEKMLGCNEIGEKQINYFSNTHVQNEENIENKIDVKVNCNYFEHKEELDNIAKKVVFTGPIDEYYNYQFGKLEYRLVRFETEELQINNYQGNAVVNYTEREIPYTRVIEHKHFEIGKQLGNEENENSPSYGHTIISREYSDKWDSSKEPYYPINNERNNELYNKYAKLAQSDSNVIFGGRLGQYKYYDMDKVIASALEICEKELK